MGATCAPIEAVCVIANHDVAVTLIPSPLPAGPDVQYTIEGPAIAADGAARFTAGGVATTGSASENLQIRGTTASAAVDNIALVARFDGAEIAREEFYVLGVEITNPTAPTPIGGVDRIMTPAAGAARTGNEFTYSAANHGILTIPVRVRLRPDLPAVRAAFQNQVRIRIDAINDSHASPAAGLVRLAWDHPFVGEPTAGNGVYNAANQRWEATATFTRLPPDNTDFGVKNVTVDVLNGGARLCRRRAMLEVFFRRDETNHPDIVGTPDLGHFSATNVDNAGAGASTRSENWFFYWNRTPAGYPGARFDSVVAPDFAWTPAMRSWVTYTGARDRVLISRVATGRDTRRDGSMQVVTGIDLYRNTIIHERRHVTQVLEHNALNPHNVAVGGARIGWSFSDSGAPQLRTVANIRAGRYNHFRVGPDGQPGIAATDDDGDGATDERDEFVAGPPDPTMPGDIGSVVGDDVDLDRDGDRISHAVPTGPDPTPRTVDNPVEPQAGAAETSPQDTHRAVDWADPGKQHGPDLAVANANGEMNSDAD